MLTLISRTEIRWSLGRNDFGRCNRPEESPLSSEYGTRQTVKARFRLWLSSKNSSNRLDCPLFAWQRLPRESVVQEYLAHETPPPPPIGPS